MLTYVNCRDIHVQEKREGLRENNQDLDNGMDRGALSSSSRRQPNSWG